MWLASGCQIQLKIYKKITSSSDIFWPSFGVKEAGPFYTYKITILLNLDVDGRPFLGSRHGTGCDRGAIGQREIGEIFGKFHLIRLEVREWERDFFFLNLRCSLLLGFGRFFKFFCFCFMHNLLHKILCSPRALMWRSMAWLKWRKQQTWQKITAWRSAHKYK